ncbi:hypothetical protein ACJX0J_012158, partial [Zea mays]
KCYDFGIDQKVAMFYCGTVVSCVYPSLYLALCAHVDEILPMHYNDEDCRFRKSIIEATVGNMRTDDNGASIRIKHKDDPNTNTISFHFISFSRVEFTGIPITPS